MPTVNVYLSFVASITQKQYMPLLHPYVHPDQRTICQRRMMTMLAGLGKSKMKPDNLQYKYQAS